MKGLVTAKNFEYHASSPIHNSAGELLVTMLDLWNYRVQQPLAVKLELSACQPKTHASVKMPYAILQVITENDLSRATVSLLWPAWSDPMYIWLGSMVQIFSKITFSFKSEFFSDLRYSFMPQKTDQVSYQTQHTKLLRGMSSGQTASKFRSGIFFFSLVVTNCNK